jgi:hypothetical protein
MEQHKTGQLARVARQKSDEVARALANLRTSLAEVHSLEQAIEVAACADQARRLARLLKNVTVQNECALIRIDATRKFGNFWRNEPKAKGGQAMQQGKSSEYTGPQSLKKRFGLSKHDQAFMSQIMRLTDAEFAVRHKEWKDLAGAEDPRLIPMTVFTAAPPSRRGLGTPMFLIDAIHQVMGEIDLDVASSEKFNHAMQAKRFHSMEHSALETPCGADALSIDWWQDHGGPKAAVWKDGDEWEWRGRCFVNPMYVPRAHLSAFLRRLTDEWDNGHVTEAITLVPLRHSCMDEYQAVMQRCSAMCVASNKITFRAEEGIGGAPGFGEVLHYLGPHHDRFAEVMAAAFENEGAPCQILIPWRPTNRVIDVPAAVAQEEGPTFA